MSDGCPDCEEITSEELLQTIGLPVIIGVVGAFLSAYISILVDSNRRKNKNLIMQLESATAICKKVVDAMEAIEAELNDYAWYVAKRRHMPKRNNDPQLAKNDDQQWLEYLDCLKFWRAHNLGYETQIKAFFGSDGYEEFLFRDADDTIEKAAGIVLNVYYSNSKEVSSEEYFDLMARLQHSVYHISETMYYCINKLQVGNLRSSSKGVPIPQGEKEKLENCNAMRFKPKFRESILTTFASSFVKPILGGSIHGKSL
mmetsp:Transcript_26316/g.39861  ORF Transcript_26316/g.39861 Transcript_26316/m.39861 type:complete len:257 (+) Transcript_26316:323-1093(+)|eukprot:CAMPEP_0178902566 /NCGR_PEP_ID=MMETSP0786-20121207/4677_1 /TAXON_ID=186022 /ORGANISM="Thalassionema frauenfeldii, Strain CCMP 1798" /LENGTH=256 /DNA_ID=CAMNT_0020573849 /DNA_START=268 /DNA_END=1038 /DNA_ORIENTATION=+